MLKKAVVGAVLAFCLYSVVATPDAAASAVRSAGNGGREVVASVVEFFNALTPSKAA